MSVGSSGPTSGISSWVWDLEHQACRESWRCLRSTAVMSALQPPAGRALETQRSKTVNKQFTGSIIRTQSWTAQTQMYKVDLKVLAEPVLCYGPLERSGWRSLRCPQLQDAASFLFFLKQKNITQVKTSLICSTNNQRINETSHINTSKLLWINSLLTDWSKKLNHELY